MLDRLESYLSRAVHWLVRTALASIAVILPAACGSGAKNATPASPPAQTVLLAHESELLKITLSADAERRLGIATSAIANGAFRRTRRFHGEVVVAPKGDGVPITATTDLSALAASQATADGVVARARAEREIAQSAAARAEALVREEAGSARIRDESLSALAVAQANLRTAEAQRALLGLPVTALGQQGTYWLRVPVFAPDLASIDRLGPASVRALGSAHPAQNAKPVKALPSANAAAGTVDLYYALDRSENPFQIGQRVAVELPVSGGDAMGAIVPASAIVSDIYGGEWVYVRTAPLSYERRRVEIAAMDDGRALMRRGPAVGTQVVIAGTAELFGTEFGAK